MSPRTHLALLAVCWLFACHEVRAFQFPESVEESYLLIATGEDGSAAYAEDRTPLVRSGLPENGIVSLLYLDQSLEYYGLPHGPLSTVDAGSPARNLPPFRTAYESLVAETLEWQPVDTLNRQTQSVRIEGPEPNDCIAELGCYRSADDREEKICTIPCRSSTVALPLPPEPARPPNFDPCPTGWLHHTLTASDTFSVCQPPPRTACAAGEAQLISETFCSSWKECDGRYATDLPMGPVYYVLAGAAAGGDGTIADPFSNIDEALAQMTEGVIATSSGTHEIGALIEVPVEIIGPCAKGTVLRGSGFTVRAAVALRDVTLMDTPIVVESGSLFAERVTFTGQGIQSATSLTLSQVLFQDIGTTALSIAGTGQLEDVVLRTITGHGLLASGNITLQRAVFEGTSSPAVFASTDARVTIEDSLFEQSAAAIQVSGATVTASRIVSRRSPGGILADQNATLHLNRAFLTGQTTGVLLRGRSSGVLSDVVAWDCGGTNGIKVEDGSALTADRLVIQGGRWVLEVERTGAPVDLRDLIVLDAGESSVNIHHTSSVSIERALLMRSLQEGIWIHLDGQAEISDLTVMDIATYKNGAPSDGYGIHAGENATLELRRALLINTIFAGISVHKDAQVWASDIHVRGEVIRAIRVGQAPKLQPVPSLTVERALAEGTSVGFTAAGNGVLELSQVTARNMNQTISDSEYGLDVGIGIRAIGKAKLTLNGFVATGCEQAGLWFDSTEPVAVDRGWVTKNQLGVYVGQNDVSRLYNVLVEDNRIPIEINR